MLMLPPEVVITSRPGARLGGPFLSSAARKHKGSRDALHRHAVVTGAVVGDVSEPLRVAVPPSCLAVCASITCPYAVRDPGIAAFLGASLPAI